MTWVEPKYTRKQVDAAAVAVLADDEPTGVEDDALEIMSNWRAAHSYPLNTFQIMLRRRALKVETSAVVVQRLKRMESIINKLKRFETLKLSQMQDIAGCRAVFKRLRSVETVAEELRSNGGTHQLRGEKNYIRLPKNDGYRGIHLIFKFSGEGPAAVYNGQRVELQLRTEMQHVWATTVEAVDAFTNQALKSNQGSEDWLRFFALMSSIIAISEKCPTVPDTPDDIDGLLPEIRHLLRN